MSDARDGFAARRRGDDYSLDRCCIGRTVGERAVTVCLPTHDQLLLTEADLEGLLAWMREPMPGRLAQPEADRALIVDADGGVRPAGGRP